ncbi:MAG: class I SAM-dependent methyltransferase [Saprospiraceae bacterium]|nr:class I SAM-dependent methyltransferase [Saprospiraceae bacterium]
MRLKILLERLPVFLRFYLRAQTIYQIHAPYLSNFILTAFDTNRLFYDFRIIEHYRRTLLLNQNLIPQNTHGDLHGQTGNKIAQLAKKSTGSQDYYECLYRICSFFKPKKILELGSCLGLSGLTLALGNREAEITTVEGNAFLANFCRETFETTLPGKINVINSSFAEFLKNNPRGGFDMVLIDGDHSYKPTLEYVKSIFHSTADNAVIIIDDIHWSPDMFKAWNEIINWPEIHCSLETYRLGFLFKSTRVTKGNFSYIPYPFKPWGIGLV